MICDTGEVTVPVKVLDVTGAPSTEATVTATNADDGRKASGVTNGAGVYVVSSTLGPGTVRVVATLNDFSSREGQFTVTASDCTPGVSPNQLVLQLK